MDTLAAEGIFKSYGPVDALRGINLAVRGTEVLGIVGENGAGKSTLLNVLSGVTAPDRGEIYVRGRKVALQNYRIANALGIFRTFQELALISTLSIYESLFLGHELYRWGVQWRREMIRRAATALKSFGLDFEVKRTVGSLTIAQQQSLEIVRACFLPELLGVASPIILLDEPTSALDSRQGARFYDVMARLRGRASCIFVSHRLAEVRELCDRIVVMKDGQVSGEASSGDTSDRWLHARMVGREREVDYYAERQAADVFSDRVVFRSTGLAKRGAFTGVSFDVRKGEIFGIAGLEGSGKSTLGRALAGAVTLDSGTIEVLGRRIVKPSSRRMKRAGIGYVPNDRKLDGIVLPLSVAENISLSGGDDMFSSRIGWWNHGLERRVAHEFVGRLGIKTQSIDQPCATLSGGNQQKVVLARWLCRSLSVLLLDNPTRGIDTGAKAELYRVFRELVRTGMTIVLISDDLPEVIQMSDRIAVMAHGRLIETLEAARGDKPDEEKIVGIMLRSGDEIGSFRGAAPH